MLVTVTYSLYLLLFNSDTVTEAGREETFRVRESEVLPSERAASYAKIIQKESSVLQRDVLLGD